MRVAIAGSGAFAQYFAEEFPAAGHEVVVLTRSHKPFFDGKPGVVAQRVTDYTSVPQLTELLNDCDALVSTISDMSGSYADVHLALLDACKQTPKCRRFIASEYGANSEDHPEQPGSPYYANKVVRDALAAQSEIEWTVIAIGWVLNFLLPPANRYHHDIGPLFSFDRAAKTLTIPGTGNEPFAITSVRDIAKAVAEMLKSSAKWRHHTNVQSEETTWLRVAETLKTVGGIPDLKFEFEPVDVLLEIFQKNESVDMAVVAGFKLAVPLGMFKLDQTKVQRDRAELFPNVRFSTVHEALEAVNKDPKVLF